ncbi:MAG: hypothetical protein ACUVWZ_16400 [Anaerolineae bacterium]
MRSELVVISWWSNCLGLACLHNLVTHTDHRPIYVAQVGKSAAQQERFRQYLPPAVQELPYPAHLPAEHGPVIETIARQLLSDRTGLWFIDHDLLVREPLEEWLEAMDQAFARSSCCLCYPESDDSLAITGPAFWVSPVRLPPDLPSFAPVPYQPMPSSRRPDLFRAPADLTLPIKDTLVMAAEYLAERGRACTYSLASFPRSDHMGGLYLFATELLPETFRDWVRQRVERFTAFYASCPSAWLEAEDPILLERLSEFSQSLSPAQWASAEVDHAMYRV